MLYSIKCITMYFIYFVCCNERHCFLNSSFRVSVAGWQKRICFPHADLQLANLTKSIIPFIFLADALVLSIQIIISAKTKYSFPYSFPSCPSVSTLTGRTPGVMTLLPCSHSQGYYHSLIISADFLRRAILMSNKFLSMVMDFYRE